MMFLFDDEHGQSQVKDFITWGTAEKYAEDMGWTLLGEFHGWADEQGIKTYVQ